MKRNLLCERGGENMPEKKYANIMLLGRTGAGKSSFINYLVGKKVSENGIGIPVTQGFETYQYDDVDGIPLQIFDSKGLEVKDYKTIKEEIFDFLKFRCGSEDVHKWIHSIFYCINISGSRIEDGEINFIKGLSGEISQTVHIILTHCTKNAGGEKQREKWNEEIRARIDNKNIKIYFVNSVKTETRVEEVEPFGREEILEQIFELLWSDIAHKTAASYAAELHQGIQKACDKIFYAFDDIANSTSALSLLSDFSSDSDFGTEQMEGLESDIEQLEEELKEKYLVQIEPLIDFCKEYGKSMGYEIELYDPFDFIPDDFLDIDFDEVFSRSKLGKLMDDLDENENLWGIIKGIGGILTIKSKLKDLFGHMKNEIRQHIPSVEKIEKEVYSAFMDGFHSL